MKRFTLLTGTAVLILTALLAAGCANGGNITDVIPTVIPTTVPPQTEALATPTPDNTEITITNPASTDMSTGGPLTTGDIIEGFSQGKVVTPEDVPDIVKAVEAKYEGASVQSITHALYMDKQMYEVIFTSQDGEQITVYVSPDGSEVTASENPMATE